MRKPTEPFASFIDSFMVAKTLAPTTREDYMRYLRDFDRFTGHTTLEKALTLEAGARWVDGLRKRGTHTARNGAMALKSFATWIKKSRYILIPGGGSILAGLEAPAVPKGSRRAFTDDEMAAIRKALAFRTNKDRVRATAAIELMVGTGLRKNEARQITVDDLLFRPEKSMGAVHVRAEIAKGNKPRTTRFGEDALRAVMAYIDDDGRPNYAGPKDKPEPLFLNKGGKGFTGDGFSTWVDRIWDDIEKLAGIKASSHWLRHKWASDYARFMHETGNSVYDLKREGGWEDLSIPLRYTHDRPEEELLDMPPPSNIVRMRRRKAS